MAVGILSFGAYLPRNRLQRSEVASVHGWFNPGLKGLGRGERTIANWDEDSITMALEAARDCLSGHDRSGLAALLMASTSFPFQDRQNAGVVTDALNLDSAMLTLDLASSQRAGSSALLAALKMAPAAGGAVLVTAAEKRHTRAASPQEMTYGDGAAAILVGEGEGVARLIGAHTEAVDFVDHFRGEDGKFDYAWEERWVREEGYNKIAPTAINALLEKTGVAPDSITTFCFPVAARRVAAGLAARLGLPESSVADNLQANCGEAGAAHPLVMLVAALEKAGPGERILVCGFGQGCDALLFETTGALADLTPRRGVAGHLENGYSDSNYARYLTHNKLIEVERGIRAEVDKITGLSTLYRNRKMAQAMIGGLCTDCGTPQFPKSNICVNPDCDAVGTQEDHPFAEKLAVVNSFTADRLTYSPDPPACYGMINFDGGGRMMADFTDITPDIELKVGMRMRMVFRVKDFDDKRGFRRYFWKAVPVDAGTGETPGKEG